MLRVHIMVECSDEGKAAERKKKKKKYISTDKQPLKKTVYFSELGF